MAYLTGTGSGVNDLLAALKSFAEGQGWLIEKWSPSSGSSLLFMSNGMCRAVIHTALNTSNGYVNGTQQNVPDHRLFASLCSDINTSLDRTWGHPGSPVTQQNDGSYVLVNDLTGPFVGWHFFSGNVADGDPPYIHVVVQTAADRYAHFSLGEVDKNGLTHSGVGYMHGAQSLWYKPFSADPTETGSNWSEPKDASTGPFNNSVYAHAYSEDVLPLSQGWLSGEAITTARLMTLGNFYDNAPVDYPEGVSDGRLLSIINRSQGPAWNGRTMLLPLPVFCLNTIAGQSCYVGDYPNVRWVNMEGLAPKQSIELPGEEWIVFPFARQAPWFQTKNADFPHLTTGQYGVAYKKVVA